MTLISAMVLGADCIDDCDVLRAGRTAAVLGHGVVAPSTIGTFLRSFTFGHVRQLDRVLADSLTGAWQSGAGPGDQRLVVDVDSFVGQVFGHAKQGAAFGYTGKRRYHPILATRADTDMVRSSGRVALPQFFEQDAQHRLTDHSPIGRDNHGTESRR